MNSKLLISFDTTDDNTEGHIVCPRCSSDYTHQNDVEIFDRKADSSKKGTHVKVTNSGVYLDSDISNTPSPRRQGLTVRIVCEQCDHDWNLNIYQHKGITYLTVTDNV